MMLILLGFRKDRHLQLESLASSIYVYKAALKMEQSLG